MKKQNNFIILFLIIMCSCKPINYINENYHSKYFPIELNQEKEFLVTNINHSSFGKDTVSYYLKEVISEKFLNLEGDSAYRIERFWKTDSMDNYEIKDIWVANKSLNFAQLVEENIRFTKLIFPFDVNVVWDGNAFNNQQSQEYRIESINIPYNVNGLSFDSSITVIQNYKSNLLEYENSKEIYVIGVGLVYKEDIEVLINSADSNDFSQGYEFYQELIEF
tara:strand:- start:72 stop:734 length:663 start_codon:yes stop_codon:yes gene_type:complete